MTRFTQKSTTNLIDIEDVQQVALDPNSEQALEAKLDLLTMESEISEPSRIGHETNSMRLENLLKRKKLSEEECQEIKVLMLNKVVINGEIKTRLDKSNATRSGEQATIHNKKQDTKNTALLTVEQHQCRPRARTRCTETASTL